MEYLALRRFKSLGIIYQRGEKMQDENLRAISLLLEEGKIVRVVSSSIPTDENVTETSEDENVTETSEDENAVSSSNISEQLEITSTAAQQINTEVKIKVPAVVISK